MDQAKSCGGNLAGLKWSYLLWGVPVLLLSASAWLGGPLRAVAWPMSFALMGSVCFTNARGCGRTHCHVTGPLYLLAAAMSVAAAWKPALYPWIAVGAALGTVAGYAWEWRRGKYLETPAEVDG